MLNVDKFIVKENDRFFIDLEEWNNGNGIPLDDGDTIKFFYEGKKYIGTLNQMSRDETVFELISIKSL